MSDSTMTAPASEPAGTAAGAAVTNTVAAPNPTTASAPAAGDGQGNATQPVGDAASASSQQAGAPEQYAAFTLPEGFVLDGERLESVTAFAKANGWTQEQAQKGVETYVQLREAERQHERGAWGAQSEAEFGKDFATIATDAQRAIVELEKARPGITARMDATNLGNHPDVLFVFAELGRRGKEGAVVGFGNQVKPEPVRMSLAERLYGSVEQQK